MGSQDQLTERNFWTGRTLQHTEVPGRMVICTECNKRIILLTAIVDDSNYYCARCYDALKERRQRDTVDTYVPRHRDHLLCPLPTAARNASPARRTCLQVRATKKDLQSV